MIEKTLVIVGPGGVGKSPLDSLLRKDVIRLDPYRLRAEGHPRSKEDPLYAHPKLRGELDRIATRLGDVPRNLGGITFYPQSRMLCFKVRKDRQFLILPVLDDPGAKKPRIAKAEIYAPVLAALLRVKTIRSLLGKLYIVVLNPVPKAICDMRSWTSLAKRTRKNRRMRGDTRKSVASGAAAVSEEGPVWRKLIRQHRALEYTDWQFPEYAYKKKRLSKAALLRHQKRIGKEAVHRLVRECPELRAFFRSDRAIERIAEPFVK